MENLENTIKELTDTVTNKIGEVKTESAKQVAELSNKITDLEKKNTDLEAKLANFKMPTVALAAEKKDPKVEFASTLRNLEEGNKIRVALANPGNIGTDAAGGYSITPVIASGLMKKLEDANILRKLFGGITVSSRDTRWNVDLGGATAGWVGEVEERVNTNAPELGRVAIEWGEIYANPVATQRLLNDAAFDIEAWYTSSVAEAMGKAEEKQFLIGTTTADVAPGGLLTKPFDTKDDDARAWGTYQSVGGDLSFDSIINLYSSLRAVYRGNGCSFLMNPKTVQALRVIKDTQGNYIWNDNVNGGFSGTLFGVPVYESAFMPEAVTGSSAILFGDFKRAFSIVDINGFNIVRDNITKKGQVSFYTSKEVGTLVGDSCAIKALKIA